MGINADVFMPNITSGQKVKKVLAFGGENVSLFLEGGNFDESYDIALAHSKKTGYPFIHPFDDPKVIEGQATVGLELLEDMPSIDYLILPVGGGGLSSGVSSVFRQLSPKTKIIGVEPTGAPSLTQALVAGFPVKLDKINTFVDGASVKRIGDYNFPLLKEGIDNVLLVDEGHVCSKILQMYNDSGIIIEPAGVLSLCALDLLKDSIEGSTVVCVISGGNSDVFRMPEILERALIYEGKKVYFRIEFPQRAGALKDFILNVMGPTDDIIYFRYTKHINKEFGPVLLGVETKSRENSTILMEKMKISGIQYEQLLNLGEI
jgi:threonine dehydratase